MTLDAADDLNQFRNDLWYARYGDPRFGYEDFTPFPSLIARADAIGDPYWKFYARLEAVASAQWSGRLTDVLTLSAWLLREIDTKGPALELDSDDIATLHIRLTGLVEQIDELPQMSVEQIHALTDDWARRATADGHEAASVVRLAQARIAMYQGDPDRAVEMLADAQYLAAPENTCEAGSRAEIAELYARMGRDEMAIALIEADLVDDGDRCNFFPAETYAPLILPYARQGRRDDVIRAARAIDEVYGRLPHPPATVADAIVGLLLVDELAAAHELAVRRIDDLVNPYSPMEELRKAAALAATFASVAAVDPDTTVPQRLSLSEPPQMRPVAELADDLAGRARAVAARFDARNHSTVVSEQTEEVLAIRATGHPAADVVPVSRRDARGLLSGMFAFRNSSMRRAEECARRLRDRLDELDPADAVRAENHFAWEERGNPETAITALHAAADRAVAVGRPHWAVQSRLLADALAIDSGSAPRDALDDFGGPDPSWEPQRQANIWNVAAMVYANHGDADRAMDAVDRALNVLGDPDVAKALADDDDSPASDAWMMRSGLLRARANLRNAAGQDAGADSDAAVVAARRALATAVTPDQRLEAGTDLVEVLRSATAGQQQTDLQGALPLLDEALEHSRYVQRAEVLMYRFQIRTAVGDLDGAIDDAEHARAVLTVEGLAHPADTVAVDLAGTMLDRGDDPRSVLDIALPATERLLSHDDLDSADRGRRVIATAQARAGLHTDAVATISAVIDALADDTPAAIRASMLRFRADENNLADLDDAAGADYTAAAALFEEAEEPLDAVDALRGAGAAAFYTGDHATAEARLAQAGHLLATLPEDVDTVALRVRVDLVIADVRKFSDPEGARILLDGAKDIARANDWVPVLVTAARIGARLEHELGNTAQALAHLDDALVHAPDDENLLGFREYIVESQNGE
jgi:tetratricopeptide (TPR) repeat protein